MTNAQMRQQPYQLHYVFQPILNEIEQNYHGENGQLFNK
jgi:hypothetical protein